MLFCNCNTEELLQKFFENVKKFLGCIKKDFYLEENWMMIIVQNASECCKVFNKIHEKICLSLLTTSFWKILISKAWKWAGKKFNIYEWTRQRIVNNIMKIKGFWKKVQISQVFKVSKYSIYNILASNIHVLVVQTKPKLCKWNKAGYQRGLWSVECDLDLIY